LTQNPEVQAVTAHRVEHRIKLGAFGDVHRAPQWGIAANTAKELAVLVDVAQWQQADEMLHCTVVVGFPGADNLAQDLAFAAVRQHIGTDLANSDFLIADLAIDVIAAVLVEARDEAGTADIDQGAEIGGILVCHRHPFAGR
jgi:hypothetical protein